MKARSGATLTVADIGDVGPLLSKTAIIDRGYRALSAGGGLPEPGQGSASGRKLRCAYRPEAERTSFFGVGVPSPRSDSDRPEGRPVPFSDSQKVQFSIRCTAGRETNMSGTSGIK